MAKLIWRFHNPAENHRIQENIQQILNSGNRSSMVQCPLAFFAQAYGAARLDADVQQNVPRTTAADEDQH